MAQLCYDSVFIKFCARFWIRNCYRFVLDTESKKYLEKDEISSKESMEDNNNNIIAINERK